MSVPDTDAVTAPPPQVVCARLAAEFPAWTISTERDDLSRTLYVAIARKLGTRPHLFSSTDPNRMRTALAGS